MKFTGRNLEMLATAIKLALAELHNQIGTCPDVNQYAEELEDLENDQEEFQTLLEKIEAAVEKEKRVFEAGGRPLTPNQYFGKVCPKHPQLKGLRCKPSYRCTKCIAEYQSARGKQKRLEKVQA